MKLVVDPVGNIRCLYSEEIDLLAFGVLNIQRASHVEPDSDGRWRADLSPVGGPVVGPFSTRSEALVAEMQWLETNWLTPISKSA